MRPIYIKKQDITNTDVSSGWVVIDQYVAPGNISVSVKLTQKTADPVSVQVFVMYTNDDVFDETLNGQFASQLWTALPWNASGIWTPTGFTGVNYVVVAEAMFAFAPRAVKAEITVLSGTLDFETQVVQLGIAST